MSSQLGVIGDRRNTSIDKVRSPVTLSMSLNRLSRRSGPSRRSGLYGCHGHRSPMAVHGCPRDQRLLFSNGPHSRRALSSSSCMTRNDDEDDDEKDFGSNRSILQRESLGALDANSFARHSFAMRTLSIRNKFFRNAFFNACSGSGLRPLRTYCSFVSLNYLLQFSQQNLFHLPLQQLHPLQTTRFGTYINGSDT